MGESLEAVLSALIISVEIALPGVICSILEYDSTTNTLKTGAAPSLPRQFNEAVNGIAVGPNAGSCGTAAYEKRRVVVENVAVDPRWKDFRDLAEQYQLRACWSEPILDVNGDVLGTYAMYFETCRAPTSEEPM